MKIEKGLFDHMVLQRNKRNVSDALFAGNSTVEGEIVVQVTSSGSVLHGSRRTRVGTAKNGKFVGRLTGIAAGGPYEVRLSIVDKSGQERDSITVHDVMVGDIWLLGGQSNMQGVGLLASQPRPHPSVRGFYMDDKWRVAREPLHNMWAAVDQIHVDLCGGVRPARNNVKGASPGLSFGLAMFERTGVPQGLIACAHGGTSMSQWDPALKDKGSLSLYGAMIRRLNKNGGRVAGLVWYQGESDAFDLGTAALYTQRMKNFVAALRQDAGDAELPVAAVQIGRFVASGSNEAWLSVQDQQRRLPEAIANCTVVPAIDLTMDDGIHISGEGQVILGKRLAEAMDVLIRGRKAGRPPIALRNITVEPDRPTGLLNVRINFDNVVNCLTANGRPTGFSVLGPNKSEQAFDVLLKGSSAIVRTAMMPGSANSSYVVYGPSFNPCCNVHDSAGRPVPVFGPIALGPQRARTGYVKELRVSMFHPSAGDLSGLKSPPKAKEMSWTVRRFTGDFCDLHTEIGAKAPQDLVVYYACQFECPESMKLSILLGYDGPVKVWFDGRAVFHDPHGTNPAVPDAKSIPVSASRGIHEIVVALGTNWGKAWGIFLAIERRYVPPRLVEKGRDYYTLPRLIG